MKHWILGVIIGIAFIGNAAAEQPACKGSQGQVFYDPDFCKAMQAAREALDLNWKLLEKSEEIRKLIDKQLKEDFEKRHHLHH